MNKLMLVALVMLLVTPALAQPNPGDREKAISHYNQAEAYFKAGTFDKAIEEYKKSYALEPAPLLLFNIGLAEQKRGKRDLAIASYEQYLAAEPTGVKADEARARLVRLVRDRDKEANAAANRAADLKARRERIATLRSQGQFLPAVGELRALYEIEGDPVLIFQIAEAYRSANDPQLAMKEYRRYLETTDRTHAADAEAQLKALREAEERRLEEERRQAAQVPPGERPSLILPAAVSGGALLFLTGGILSGLRANSLESDLRNEFLGPPPIDSGDDRFDEGRTVASTATALFIVGGVTTAVAGYFWYRYFSKQRANERRRTTVAPTGRGAMIWGTF